MNDARQDERSQVSLKIKFKSQTLDQFIERYSVDISHGGIFIRTKEPLAVGTSLRFEFQLKDATPLITGTGTVVWTREHDAARSGVAPGMGVRFDRLNGESQSILDQILAQKTTRSAPPATKPAPIAGAPADDDDDFKDTPTKVAPADLVDQLSAEEEGDLTPLPRPMPFHSDADEFPDDTFEETTRVAALEGLALSTADGDGDDVVAEESERADTVAEDRSREIGGASRPVSENRDDAEVGSGAASLDDSTFSLGNAGQDSAGEDHTAATSSEEDEEETAPAVAAAYVPDEDSAPAPEKSRGGGLSIAAAAVILVGGGVGAYWYMNRGDDAGQAQAQPAEETAPTAAAAAAEEPAPEPEVEVETFATEITAEPEGAEVKVVGGEASGSSPATLELPAGTHQVEISHPEYISQTIEVEAGAEVEKVKLEAKERVIAIESTPPGAAVFVDRKPKGMSPVEVPVSRSMTKRGKVSIELRKAGYISAKETVDLSSGFAPDGDRLVHAVASELIKRKPVAARTPPVKRPTGGEDKSGDSSGDSKTGNSGDSKTGNSGDSKTGDSGDTKSEDTDKTADKSEGGETEPAPDWL